MKRRGVISFDLLVGNPGNIKKYLLLYDELWVPFLLEYLQAGTDEEAGFLEAFATVEWLTSQAQVTEPEIDLRSGSHSVDEVVNALATIHNEATDALDRTYPDPETAALEAGAALFNIDMCLSRLITYLMWRDYDELVFPVVFPFEFERSHELPEEIGKTQEVLSIVLNRFPDPPPDLPLEDIVFFKQDPETQYKYHKLWNWIRKVVEQGKDRRELEEEIDWLLTDYTYHLQQLTKKINYDRLKIWVGLPGDMIEDLVKFRWGELARRLFEMKGVSIAAHEAELKAPGSEIAYVKESVDLLSPRESC